jgi:hypothetical protein
MTFGRLRKSEELLPNEFLLDRTLFHSINQTAPYI